MKNLNLENNTGEKTWGTLKMSFVILLLDLSINV